MSPALHAIPAVAEAPMRKQNTTRVIRRACKGPDEKAAASPARVASTEDGGRAVGGEVGPSEGDAGTIGTPPGSGGGVGAAEGERASIVAPGGGGARSEDGAPIIGATTVNPGGEWPPECGGAATAATVADRGTCDRAMEAWWSSIVASTFTGAAFDSLASNSAAGVHLVVP
ncbi:MAG TPA: hypothetical protein VEK07_00640, partial [Polyangiaceae bacterium]|nr:hypothetical protein [Polyangiaceae bacterium]